MFKIEPLNEIRMVPVKSDFNPERYQTIPFDDGLQIDQTLKFQHERYYAQKFTIIDTPTIQILSSYSNITAYLYKCCNNQNGCSNTIVLEPSVVESESMITGILASIYECKIDLSLVGEGDYFLVIRYEEEEDIYKEWVSETLNVKEQQIGTLCFEYTNSRNDFSMVFKKDQEGIETWTGRIRVESAILDFKPSSVDLIYVDQIHSTTQINGTAFRQWTLYVGGDGVILPDYILDKINRILLCNQVSIDGKYYSKSEGAQWEENRNEGEQFSAQSITITETENRFKLKLDTSGITEDFMAIQKEITFNNNNSDITIPNKFNKYTRLEYISIFNPTAASFILTIQTETQGTENDIAPHAFNINGDLTKDISYFFLFDRLKTLKITGIEGILLNIFIGYKKLDANPGTGTIGSIGGRIRTVSMYHGTPEQFALDFDTDTGLGRTDGPYEGCAVCNGNHGTPNLVDKMIIANDGITDQVLKPMNESAGSWVKKILKTDLPIVFLKMFGAHLPGGPPSPLPFPHVPLSADSIVSPEGSSPFSNEYSRMSESPISTVATLGKTSGFGGSNGDGTGDEEPRFNVMGNYYRLVFYKQIV